MQKAQNQLSVRLSVLLAAVCAVFLLIGGAADAGEPDAPPIEYVVNVGDTLWSIAGVHLPSGGDVRSLIYEIRDLSGLESSLIRPGQILLIPQG